MTNPTWNGEAIITSANSFAWYATLDGYDPTPWDSDTPAKGPHSRMGMGHSKAQAICDLIERLMEIAV